MKVFISQPMNGKTDEEILETRKRITEMLYNTYPGSVEIIDSYIDEEPGKDINKPLWYLSKSIELLSEADTAYFAKGWGSARGCKIEYTCAEEYGLTIFKESY